MKQKVWIVLITVGVVFIFGSQLLVADVGIKAGISWVNLKLSRDIPGVELSSRSEIIVGAFYSINLFNFLAVQPELNYVTRGVNTTEGDEFGKWEFSYLEIPVLFKFKILSKGKIRPNIFIGPYLAINTKSRVTETENNITEEADLEDFTESMDYGLVLGGCVEYKMGFGRLILDVRYNLGLVSILENLMALTGGDLTDDDTVKTRSFAVLIGFAFEL